MKTGKVKSRTTAPKQSAQGLSAQARIAADLVKALANPMRLKVLHQLRSAELTASDLVRLCRVSKANLSQHINLLKREGLVACEKRGTFCHYSIADKRVLRALDSLEAILHARNTAKSAHMRGTRKKV